MKKRENNILDILKFVAAILILGAHASPIINSKSFDLFYGEYLFRFCVPLFIISSGFFFESIDKSKKKKYIKRILYLYIFSTLLYLPMYYNQGIKSIIINILTGYWHLWYLVALLIALCIVYIFDEKFKNTSNKSYIIVISLLILCGAFFDEYHKIINVPYLDVILKTADIMIGEWRAIFFSLPMLLIGKLIKKNWNYISSKTWKTYVLLLIISAVAAFLEFILLCNSIGTRTSNDITLFNWIPAVALFILSFYINERVKKLETRKIRKMADVIYIIHLWVIVLFKVIFSLRYLSLFIACSITSVIISYITISIISIIKSRKTKIYCLDSGPKQLN